MVRKEMEETMKKSLSDIAPYVTRDGSLIREIVHPSFTKGVRLSVAEATVEQGGETFLHLHRTSQEIYHILSGQGTMTLGKDIFPVKAGDSILIMPGTAHRIKSSGNEPLRILCCCHPPYDHGDTELLDRDD